MRRRHKKILRLLRDDISEKTNQIDDSWRSGFQEEATSIQRELYMVKFAEVFLRRLYEKD